MVHAVVQNVLKKPDEDAITVPGQTTNLLAPQKHYPLPVPPQKLDLTISHVNGRKDKN